MDKLLKVILFPVSVLAFLVFALKAVISITFFFIFAALTVSFSWAYIGCRNAMRLTERWATR